MSNRMRMRWRAAAALSITLAMAESASAIAQEAVQATPPPGVTSRELVEARGLSGLMLSPDKKYAVFRVDYQDVERHATILEWWVATLKDGRVLKIADGGTPRFNNNGFVAPETPQWSPDSSWIYFRRVHNQEAQVWRVRRDGGGLQQITHDEADVQAFIITPEGRVHYAVGPATRSEIIEAEQREHDDGVLLDGRVIKGFPISRSFPINGRMAIVRSDAQSVTGRSTLLGSQPLRTISLDAALRPVRSVDPVMARRFDALWTESYGGLRVSDPCRAGRATDEKTGRSASLELGAVGDRSPKSRSGRVLRARGPDNLDLSCTDPVCLDADGLNIIGWLAAGDEMIFQTRTFETVRLNAWNVRTDRVRTVLTTEGVLGSSDSGVDGECQLADGEAICIAAAADSSPKLARVNLQTGAVRSLFDPNPNLSPDRLGVASKITVTDRFGNMTVGRLIRSRAETGERKPLVITSYSCRGFLLGGSGRDVPEHVLAGLGFAAVCVDHGYSAVRRAEGFVVSQEHGNASSLDFFENTVHLLDGEGVVDTRRVLLTGFSGSATATAYAITESSSFTAAAVGTEGSLDPMLCYLTAHFRSCEQLAKQAGLSPPYDSPSGILRQSPALNVERIRTPLLMQLAEVEYVGMTQLYSAMLDYGRAVEMYIFPDAYHYKNDPRQRLAVYRRNVDWAEFWLRGAESGDPRMTVRDQRWRQLRDTQCGLFDEKRESGRPWYCEPR